MSDLYYILTGTLELLGWFAATMVFGHVMCNMITPFILKKINNK